MSNLNSALKKLAHVSEKLGRVRQRVAQLEVEQNQIRAMLTGDPLLRISKGSQRLLDAMQQEGDPVVTVSWVQEHLGLSRGAATQRLRRAHEWGLLKKTAYGQYKLNAR